ncbi:LytTR family DNA-binding domain-containing protein [Spirosoma foliorum]|uniref:LytTR family transcriptional regulator DNA-binding domain-containing protein n=1 Tax=Spirosoma foliorum TaxID=2710596 RepID=A0A7G5GVD8_9BACT|nr:LytTR family DNA-binding domain-containing protein [Spirosoma foliorum]QMW02830.1 LytTR family transcriptional regulator DNA-binding domain-containing protein [Spirosoma foliorum]
MKEIQIRRDFLKKPFSSLIILLCIVGLIEAVSWSIGYKLKIKIVHDEGGILQYIGLIIRGLFLPELFTLFITITLLNLFHRIWNIHSVEYNWRSIYKYELRFLPVLLFAFLAFNPGTQTIRFILESFPNYSWSNYWQKYILHTFTWTVYFKYLFPVILIGYIAMNVSLLQDYLKQRREAQEAAEAEAAEASQKVLALSETFSPPPVPATPSPYLSYIKGKSNLGEIDFPVNEAYYFTVEDRFYYAETLKERYMVSKTLNDLETELDPTQFFRIKRDYIVNRQAVLHYSYWENGKYIVTLNTPDHHKIIVPRVRMHEFREWLQGRDASKPEHANLL